MNSNAKERVLIWRGPEIEGEMLLVRRSGKLLFSGAFSVIRPRQEALEQDPYLTSREAGEQEGVQFQRREYSPAKSSLTAYLGRSALLICSQLSFAGSPVESSDSFVGADSPQYDSNRFPLWKRYESKEVCDAAASGLAVQKLCL